MIILFCRFVLRNVREKDVKLVAAVHIRLRELVMHCLREFLCRLLCEYVSSYDCVNSVIAFTPLGWLSHVL